VHRGGVLLHVSTPPILALAPPKRPSAQVRRVGRLEGQRRRRVRGLPEAQHRQVGDVSRTSDAPPFAVGFPVWRAVCTVHSVGAREDARG
jgi:hypothetical protein